MIAAVFKRDKNLAIENVPVRKISADELLIKVHTCGVCGTDYHIIKGDSHSNPPVILGHEFSGVVVEVGKMVEIIDVGDRVTVDPNIICGFCHFCRSGQPNHCENLKALGVDINGGFAEYAIVPVNQTYVIPEELSLEEAAFAEPLSCCIHGIKQAGISSRNTVVVIGGGSIGLLMVQLAKLSGALKVVLVEPVKGKRLLASKLGVELVIDPNEPDIFQDNKDVLSQGNRIRIECVGKHETAELALKLAGKNGRVLLFGIAPKGDQINIDLQYVFKNEIRIISSFLNPFTFPEAVELLSKKKINVADLISKRTELENINTIFESDINTHFIKHQVTNHN